MLRELHITNLAVIADARIELHRGLNCFTGATGAGKSLVIGAIEVLLGLRSPAEMLRAGVDEGRVSGVFEIASKRVRNGNWSALRIFRWPPREANCFSPAGFMRRAILRLAQRQSDHAGDAQAGGGSAHRRPWPARSSVSTQAVESARCAGSIRRSLVAAPAIPRRVRSHPVDQIAHWRNFRPIAHCASSNWSYISSRPGRSTRRNWMRMNMSSCSARASLLKNLEKIKKDAGGVHAALYEADGSVLERLKMMSAILAELGEVDQNAKPIAGACAMRRYNWKKPHSICRAISTSSISIRPNWEKWKSG